MQLSLDTLLLLRQILLAQQLNVGADDFRQAAVRVAVALDELDAAIAVLAPPPEDEAPARPTRPKPRR